MITADTITDEQIVQLHNDSIAEARFTTAYVCIDALSSTLAKYDPGKHRYARGTCAAILNARGGK